MKRRGVFGVALIATLGTILASPGAAAGSSQTIGPGQKVTRSGHLEGAALPGFALAPYRQGLTEQVCTPAACDELTVHLVLKKGQRYGDLSAVVTAPTRSLGVNIRVFDAAGTLVARAEGGGVGAGVPGGEVSAYTVASRIRAGTYRVHVYVSAGVADFTQTLVWRPRR